MSQGAGEFNLEHYILSHVQNSQEWHLPFLPGIHLPPFLTLHSLMLLIAGSFVLFLFCVVYRKDQKVPSGATNLLEAVVLFIRDKIAIANLGEEEGRKYTPFFCTVFFFILIMNMMGLIPLFSAATSNISVPLALMLIIFTLMTFGTIMKRGIGGFFGHFVIPGLPVYIQVLLFPLEVFSLFTRSFALMIRLFANMLAGHMMIMAFLGLVVLLGFIAMPSVLMAVMISILEVLITVLQAYIFTLLSAVYIGQMHREHH